MFDFPSAPSNGQQVTAPNGAVYAWNGTSWAPVSIGLPAYAPLASPVFTGDARAVTPAYGDNDTSIPTTAFVQSAVAPVANNTGRNLVMNGAFTVAQRGAGPWTTNVYTADRWFTATTLDTISVQVAAMTDTDRTQIGDETASYRLTNTFSGNAGVTANSYLDQRIEKVSRTSGKTVTVSFYANATAGLKVGINLAQVFGSGGSPSASIFVQTTGTAITLSTTWTRYTATFTVPSITGKTLGTNGDDQLTLRFFYSSGANTNATAGNIGVQSGTINLWGIQLEIGSVATPFDAGGTPADQLRQCQRFYQSGILFNLAGPCNSGNTLALSQYLAVTMRAAPTLAITSNSSNGSVGTPTFYSAATWATVNCSATVTGNAIINIIATASADL